MPVRAGVSLLLAAALPAQGRFSAVSRLASVKPMRALACETPDLPLARQKLCSLSQKGLPRSQGGG